MSSTHLEDLEAALRRSHWTVAKRCDGDNYRVSAIWAIARQDGSELRHIVFEGLHDLETLPIDQSYGCHVREAPEVALYFARVGRSWPKELKAFLHDFDRVAS